MSVSSHSSDSFSIIHSEDSDVVRAAELIATTNARLATINKSMERAKERSPSQEEEEMVVLKVPAWNANPSQDPHSTSQADPLTLASIQPLTPADKDELALALSQSQHGGFAAYGNSSLQQRPGPSPFNPARLQYVRSTTKSTENVQSNAKPAEQKLAAKKKRKKISHPLPPALVSFNYDQKHRLIFGEEENPEAKNKGKGDIGPFKVATKAITGSHQKGNYEEHDLKGLKSEQIRTFAMNLGCTRVGSLSKFLVRKEIALRIELGAIYEQVNVPSVRTTSEEKKLNSLVRIINACFLPNTVDRLIQLNDIKKRNDFEAAHGANPVKDFWLEISNLVNDTEEVEVGILLYSSVAEDKHIPNWQDDGEAAINLSDFNTQTFKSVKTHMGDLFKCRRLIQDSRGQSGTHDDDTWNYCQGKHLKPRKGVDMPAKAVYYFDKCCSKHKDIDAAFTDVLAPNLKSDSSEPPHKDKEAKMASASKVKEDFLKAIEKTNEAAMAANEKASTQRAEMIELQRKELEEKSTSMLWSEYAKMSETYTRMKDSPGGSAKLLQNLGKRLQALESKIGITEEESVVETDD